MFKKEIFVYISRKIKIIKLLFVLKQLCLYILLFYINMYETTSDS